MPNYSNKKIAGKGLQSTSKRKTKDSQVKKIQKPKWTTFNMAGITAINREKWSEFIATFQDVKKVLGDGCVHRSSQSSSSIDGYKTVVSKMGNTSPLRASRRSWTGPEREGSGK